MAGYDGYGAHYIGRRLFRTSRSDCHAWSSSPNIMFLSLICGIKPAAPGFRKVIIEPHLNGLDRVKGTMPHPNGSISVSLEKKGDAGVTAELDIPEGVTGWFVWNHQKNRAETGQAGSAPFIKICMGLYRKNTTDAIGEDRIFHVV